MVLSTPFTHIEICVRPKPSQMSSGTFDGEMPLGLTPTTRPATVGRDQALEAETETEHPMNSDVTFVGNLVREPELRHSQAGNPRATFTVAVNEGQGDNEVTHFLNVTAFGTLGENIVESMDKGQRIVVSGRISSYNKPVTIDGSEKELTMITFIANAAGPDLRWATAKPVRNPRKENGNSSEGSKPKAKAAAAASSDNDDF